LHNLYTTQDTWDETHSHGSHPMCLVLCTSCLTHMSHTPYVLCCAQVVQFCCTILKNRENFTKGYRTIPCFYRRILNSHSSRTRGFNDQNESQKGISSVLGVKTRRKSIHVTFLMSLVFFAPDFNGYIKSETSFTKHLSHTLIHSQLIHTLSASAYLHQRVKCRFFCMS